MADEMVTITAQRFATLVRHEAELDVLTSCLFGNADLAWDGESLQPDAKAASAVLRSMYPNVYKQTVDKLVKRKGE